MRATSSGGFGSARGILERCCRPWPFWPRGTSNTTETEARAALGSPYIGSHQLLHYSRWPMANRMDEVPIVVLRRRNTRSTLKMFQLFDDIVDVQVCRTASQNDSYKITRKTIFINNIADLGRLQGARRGICPPWNS